MSALSVQLNYEFQEPDSRDYTMTYDEAQGILTTSTGTVLEASDLSYSFVITDLSNINILTQGPIGTCVANAYALTMSILATDVSFMSRLYVYTNARILSAVPISKDTGVTIRKGAHAIVKHGSCPEVTWPYYPINSFPRFPDFKTYHDASLISGFNYYFPVTSDPISLKQILLTFKTPIIFGIKLYDSFFSNYVSSYGVVTVPNMSYEKFRGGHCMTIVGYDDMVNGGSFIVANSWGASWGYKGFAYIPYSYMANPRLCCDFCVVNFTSVHPRLPFATKAPLTPLFPFPPPPIYPNVNPTPKPAPGPGPSRQAIIDAINAYNASLQKKKHNKKKLIIQHN